MTRRTITRRTLAAGTFLIAASGIRPGFAQETGTGSGGLLMVDADSALFLADPVSGSRLFTYAISGKPQAAWAASAPGKAIVQSNSTLSVVDTNDGSALAVSLPADVAASILPSSIQFRGSAGIDRMLIGTPNMDANTFVLDLTTGERMAVVGLLQAETAPVSLPNVAISADDLHLLAWDGRSTWIVDLDARTSRLLGTRPFTFSAGFNPDGSQITYSQQLQDGSTELRLQSATGFDDQVLFKSDHILVALWMPDGRMLLDERTDDGGNLSLFDPVGGKRLDLLEYTGATNIVQFDRDGSAVLVGIEGSAGRDWYLLSVGGVSPRTTLLIAIQDAVITPGFAFNSDWAVASMPVSDTQPGAILAVRLQDGSTVPLIEDIGTDAALTNPIVAPFGPGALISVDSFTELAVHFLQLEDGIDNRVDTMKGGDGVIAPDASGFAVSFGLNTGGTTTIVYDQQANQITTIQGAALAWV